MPNFLQMKEILCVFLFGLKYLPNYYSPSIPGRSAKFLTPPCAACLLACLWDLAHSQLWEPLPPLGSRQTSRRSGRSDHLVQIHPWTDRCTCSEGHCELYLEKLLTFLYDHTPGPFSRTVVTWGSVCRLGWGRTSQSCPRRTWRCSTERPEWTKLTLR